MLLAVATQSLLLGRWYTDVEADGEGATAPCAVVDAEKQTTSSKIDRPTLIMMGMSSHSRDASA